MSLYDEVMKQIPLKENFDLNEREIQIEDKEVKCLFLSCLTNEEYIMELIKSLKKKKVSKKIIYKINNSQVEKIFTIKDILFFLYEGEAILFVSKLYALRIGVRSYPLRGIQEPEAEKAIRGSKDGFNESIMTNIALVRRRIKTSHLKVESFVIGKYSSISVAVLYMDNKVKKYALRKIRKELEKIELDSLVMSDRALEEAVFKQNRCLYPLVRYTERPDIASIHILNGKIIIIVDTSSSAIITPVTLFDHLRHVEEFRQTPIVGSFTRLLRIISIMLSLFLVPTFLCVLSKTNLHNVFSLSAPEGGTNIFSQALIATIILEIFRIAIVHTPSPLSGAISLVSAVILGQVSMDLGVFSPEILLFVCISSICGFANPSYELSLVNKLVQIVLIVLAWIFGIPGYVLGVLGLFLYLVQIKVLDMPYLYPFCPFNKDKIKYTIIRPSHENKKNV